MSKNKGDNEGQGISEEFVDRSVQLSPAQVKAYVQPTKRVEVSPGKFKDVPVTSARNGITDFNNGAILVKSKHPVDELLRRSIIEEHHQDSAKRIMTIRDCAFSRSAGRIYNDLGEGDSGVDAMTLYVTTCRKMPTRPMQLIEIVCFRIPDIDGNYYNEADYSALYRLAPNIQNAFDLLDGALREARDEIKERISAALDSGVVTQPKP